MRRSRRRTGTGPARRWRLLGPVAAGIAITLATSAVPQRTLARYGDIDACVESCSVVAGGWPLPYLVDYPGLSPGNAVSLSGAILGLDRWRFEGLAFDVPLWTAIAALALALLHRARR